MPTKSAAESVKGSPAASDYVERTDVQEYLKDISNKQGIPLEWLMNEVALARYSPLSERYTTPRPNADKKTTAEKNFLLYERNIVNAERIERGTAFLRDHQEVFARIEEESGVSRYAVAAIIGVESIYGRNMGRFRVLDALMTLSFDYTRRAKYYRSELTDFLDFCWKQQISPVSVTGSFAGAMGLGQFMPASLRAYGKDGDGDGHIDVVNSPADGIASVANYLAVHGWVRGERPLYRVSATDAIFKATGSGGIKTHTTAGALYKAGVKPLEAIPLKDDEPALLVDLPWIKSNNERGVDYYLGTGSFAAILRYNRSSSMLRRYLCSPQSLKTAMPNTLRPSRSALAKRSVNPPQRPKPKSPWSLPFGQTTNRIRTIVRHELKPDDLHRSSAPRNK